MKQRSIGDIRVARVIELVQDFPAREFFPDTTEDDWAPHRDWLIEEGALTADTDSILLPMQSYVVWTSHHTILIDTCIGNHKERPHRPAWPSSRDRPQSW